MIVCEKMRWVFVRNPRTASRSVSALLLSKFECKELLPIHRVSVPEEYGDFVRQIVLRNPIERAASIWLSAQNTLSSTKRMKDIPARCRYEELTRIKDMSFTEFVRAEKALLPCEVKHGDLLYEPDASEDEKVVEFEGSDYKLKLFNFFHQHRIIARLGAEKTNIMLYDRLDEEIERAFGTKNTFAIGRTEYDRLSIRRLGGFEEVFQEDAKLCRR